MSLLEVWAKQAWLGWADYLKRTFCSDCGQSKMCGAARVSGPFLCLECWDVSRYAPK